MIKYETMFILKPGQEDDAYQAVVEKFTTLITDQGGEVTNVNAWTPQTGL